MNEYNWLCKFFAEPSLGNNSGASEVFNLTVPQSWDFAQHYPEKKHFAKTANQLKTGVVFHPLGWASFKWIGMWLWIISSIVLISLYIFLYSWVQKNSSS